MAAQIIGLVNLKGGVGKTALAVNLATSLAHELGERVLLVDLDPQSNASISVMGPVRWQVEADDEPTRTIYGLLTRQNPIGVCIVRDSVKVGNMAVVPKLHLLPSCYRLMDFEDGSSLREGEPHYVSFWKELMGCIDSYDFILLDCPPNLYRTTQCAIFSSRHILVPCNPDSLSAIGLSLLAKKIHDFKRRTEAAHDEHRPGQKQADICGVVINNKPPTELRANRYSDTLIRSKLNYLKQTNLTAPDAEIIPVSIRHAADFRTGSFHYQPLLFAKEVRNRDLLEDYRNLARFVISKFRGSHE